MHLASYKVSYVVQTIINLPSYTHPIPLTALWRPPARLLNHPLGIQHQTTYPLLKLLWLTHQTSFPQLDLLNSIVSPERSLMVIKELPSGGYVTRSSMISPRCVSEGMWQLPGHGSSQPDALSPMKCRPRSLRCLIRRPTRARKILERKRHHRKGRRIPTNTTPTIGPASRVLPSFFLEATERQH
jgi:hypothetical protein